MSRAEYVVPILRVADVAASIAYYRERLGFESDWRWGDPPGCVRRDAIELFFCKECQGAPGTWMSIWVDDVDAMYEELRQRGAEIVQPPTNFEWGVREMNVQDLDGHRLRLGSDATGPADEVHLAEKA